MTLNPTFGDPELAGAACTGMIPLFDEIVDGETEKHRDYRHRAALRICQTCPVIQNCQDIFDQLPKGQQFGVWAGTLHTSSKRATTTGAPGSTTERTAA